MRYSCNWVGKGGSWHSVMATCSLAGGFGGQFVHPWRPSLLKVLLPTPRVVANLWDLGFWNTFWEHYTCSHGPFAAECWAFTKWRWESAAASLPTLLVMLPGFLLLFFSSIFYRAFLPSGSDNAGVSRTWPCCCRQHGDLCYLFTSAHCYCSLALHKVKRLSGLFYILLRCAQVLWVSLNLRSWFRVYLP